MDLSFEEKSAWGSLLAISVASWLFFPMAVAHIAAGGELIDLTFRIVFVIGVIIAIEIVYHAVIAGKSRNSDADERDAQFNLKADRIAGYVLGFGVVWIVGLIMIRSSLTGAPAVPSSVMVSIYLLMAITASEASKLLSQIWFYRAES
jgi:hypothetical protein